MFVAQQGDMEPEVDKLGPAPDVVLFFDDVSIFHLLVFGL